MIIKVCLSLHGHKSSMPLYTALCMEKLLESIGLKGHTILFTKKKKKKHTQYDEVSPVWPQEFYTTVCVCIYIYIYI